MPFSQCGGYFMHITTTLWVRPFNLLVSRLPQLNYEFAPSLVPLPRQSYRHCAEKNSTNYRRNLNQVNDKISRHIDVYYSIPTVYDHQQVISNSARNVFH